MISELNVMRESHFKVNGCIGFTEKLIQLHLNAVSEFNVMRECHFRENASMKFIEKLVHLSFQNPL